MARRPLYASDEWIQGFFGATDRGEEDSHSLLEAPPPSPDPGLERALAEAMEVHGSETSPPRLNRPPQPPPPPLTGVAPPPPPTYLSNSRRRLVGLSPPPQITVAQRQFYSHAQQSLYSGASERNPRDDLTALAKAAGKKKRRSGDETKKKDRTNSDSGSSRFITTKSKRVLKVAGKKSKTKSKKKIGRKSLSRSWPNARDSSGFSSMYQHRDDYYDRQAERAEMERGDRK